MRRWHLRRHGYTVELTRLRPRERPEPGQVWLVEVTEPGGTSSSLHYRPNFVQALRVFYLLT